MATIHHFDTLPSTNDYLKLLDIDNIEEFHVIIADEQTSGKGQKGNHWHSKKGENITMSILLHPNFIEVPQQFLLTQCISLAIVDCLASHIPTSNNIHIKWPNDIYAGNRKICGTLIETTLLRNRIANAICGIGLNINQTDFPTELPNAISLCQIINKETPLNKILQEIVANIEQRYSQLRRGYHKEIESAYHELLMNCEKMARYSYHGHEIEAKIIGTDKFGRLILKTIDGEPICCLMKEIQYLLD